LNIIDLIKSALQEDMPSGDITTESLGVPPRIGTARLIAKQNLVLSGHAVFEKTVTLVEPNAKMKWHFNDGDQILSGQTICSLHADLVQLLKAERTALNFLMHLSGIATLTSQYVKLTQGSSTLILDTRKTLPGYRELEKRAVKDGGGFNHRMNLSDAILVKDNHVALVGGITEAVKRIRQYSNMPITVEASSIKQVQECVTLGVSRILLDNFDDETLVEALKLIPATIKTEVSGNVSKERVPFLCSLGVNYISIGALTHSAPSADISLLFDWS